jgi:hypothetical protein
MKTDAELLPLFAKMLPNVTVSGETITESSTLGVRNIEWYGLLYLCQRVEISLTYQEWASYVSELSDPTASTFEERRRFISATWQARVQAAAKVKGLI